MTDIVDRLLLPWFTNGGENLQKEAAAEITALREKLERAERERDEALNELDAVYAAIGTSDAEGAPEAAVTIESIFCERDALQARVERLEKALRFYAERMTYTSRTGMECGITKDHFGDRARAALAADGENNDRD